MKTKNIFKTVALAMLMPAMMLTTACSNDDEAIVNNETTNKKGYALPVTVNVTRQGDKGSNRASYTDNGDKTGSLAFSEGDKLFVSGQDNTAGSFKGVLTWVSGGTFSGSINTQNEYTGTAEALLTGASYVTATLLPAGYESYAVLSIEDETDCSGWVGMDLSKAFAPTKKAAVEQFSYERATSYSSGFALSPDNAIVSFTISGLAANTEVAVLFKDAYATGATPVNVTTDASGVATFAVAVNSNDYIDYYTLTVGGNAITLPDNTAEAGHIYNITRAVTPPTLAQTMNTADMTVKVKYNYENDENYCLFSSVGDGTYAFQSGDGWAGGDGGCAKALVVEDGKLVFKQNVYDTIDDLWSNYGFSATFDTSKNTYSNWVGKLNYHNPSFISVEVNSVPIALTQIITVSDLVKEEGQYWSEIITNNSEKIKEDGGYVVRISDNAKLQYSMGGDHWQDVMSGDSYQPMYNTYKFEGD